MVQAELLLSMVLFIITLILWKIEVLHALEISAQSEAALKDDSLL